MKKKLWIPVLAAVLVLAAVIAGIAKDETTFTEFLDENHMFPGMGQGEFMELRDNYSFLGKTLTEQTSKLYYDGYSGGGCSASGRCFDGRHFGFWNDYEERGSVAVYTNEIYTQVPFVGLTLPHDIAFADHLLTVLAKVGFSINSYEGYQFGFNRSGNLVLVGENGITYTLSNVSDTYSGVEYAYMLEYAENSERTRSNGKVVKVKRYVKMLFLSETETLGGIYFGVQERYAVD